MNTSRLSLILMAGIALSQSAMAQDLLEGKQVFTLGEAKTWSKVVNDEEVTYTFITDNLEKLTETPKNTSNIYLFPEEGGGWNTEANREIGIQGFYVDLGASQNIGVVETTWEGAAANAYDIYVTDAVPTLSILNTTPTFSATNLGQYQANSALMPDNTKGRYLVFQPTDATNWGWGVKIRSISAMAPEKSVLTSFSVTPGILMLGETKELTTKTENQFGLEIEGVTISVSDNASYIDGMLTINSGDYATVTATYDGVSIETNVYAATAPSLPSESLIKTPIFTNTVTEYNADAVFTTAYNGGAQNYGLFEFATGEVAQGFGNTRCVFFSNSATTGAWNGNINPEENGYKTLCLDVFATRDVTGNINFEGTEPADLIPTANPFSLIGGEWNHLSIKVEGATKLSNLSIRFDADNASDILLANIYFSAEVESTVADLIEDNATLTIFTMQGIRVASADLTILPAGLYIVNGKKVAIR